MEIEELTKDGLKRSYKVSIDEADIDRRVQLILMDARDKVNLKGFRPGKAPLSLLKKLHGEAARAQAVEEAVRETTDKVFRERKERPAIQPEIELGETDSESGVDFTVTTEILPEIDTGGFKPPKLERKVAEPSEADIDAALERLAEQSKSFESAAKTRKAKSGDAAVIDFAGTIDGESFEGGSGEDVQIELGAGRFLDEIEAALVGAKAGDSKQVAVTFPESAREGLSGKTAQFDVTVKEVKTPKTPAVDDELAKTFGLDDLDALKSAMREQLEGEAKQLSRQQVKRNLLDKLAEAYDFEVPERMVEAEYQDIWRQIKQDMIASGEASEADLADKEEPDSEEERKDFRNIAERRVRLGLLLSEVGMANNVELSRQEVTQKAAEEARKYPGQEQQVFEFLTQNEQAMAQLRAPIYEDKVVDFVLEMAEIEEKTVSLEELRRIVTEEDEEASSEKPSKAGGRAKKKKPAAKSSKSSKSDGKAKAAPKKTASKTSAKSASGAKSKAGAASKPSAKSGKGGPKTKTKTKTKTKAGAGS